jgi:hypothetical protein
VSEYSPDELRALIALEKESLVDPGPARERLAGRLAGALAVTAAASALPAVAKAAAPGLITAALKRVPWGVTGLAAMFAGGVGVGAAVHSVVATPVAPKTRVEVRYVDRVVEVERPRQPEPAPMAAVVEAPVAPPASAPVPRPKVEAVTPDQELAHERLLIDQARSALARGDASGALAAVEEHARAFQHGQFVEPREALAVQALVNAKRYGEASARARHFHAAFPQSLYGPVVDAATAKIP